MKTFLSKEERTEIDKIALKKEEEDAQIRADEDLRKSKAFRSVILISSVYEVPVWQKSAKWGFWERCPLEKLEDKRYRLYFHCWSEVLQDVVQVAVTELSANNFKRMVR